MTTVMTPRRWLAVLVLLAVAGCTKTFDELLPDRRPDYRQTQVANPLEIPPDLTESTIDDTLLVPELNPTGSASLSTYASERQAGGQIAFAEAVLQQQPGVQLERDGNQRWLLVDVEPQAVWPRVKEFWTSNGFVLKRENPLIGIMETDWAENRADIPEGPVRALLGQVIDFAYSAPTRDKFRVRLERVDDGTEVYLTHYGVEEVIRGGTSNRQGSEVLWQSRPADPELEAEMLKRLMVYLGATERRAQTQMAAATEAEQQGPRVRRATVAGNREALIVGENYSRAWRLVGLALDGSNFVVEDQNRSEGLYVVEYNDQLEDSQDQGWFSRLAFWKGREPPPEGERYRVRLAGRGDETVVVVHDASDRPDNSPNAELILDAVAQVLQ